MSDERDDDEQNELWCRTLEAIEMGRFEVLSNYRKRAIAMAVSNPDITQFDTFNVDDLRILAHAAELLFLLQSGFGDDRPPEAKAARELMFGLRAQVELLTIQKGLVSVSS